MVTGLTVLITGFIQIRNSKISVYHFTVVIDLAWMSSNAHLLALVSLRKYLRGEEEGHKRRLFNTPDHQRLGHRRRMAKLLKIWRLACMLFLFCFLFSACAVQGHQYWWDSFNCPTECVIKDLHGNIGGEPGRWMIANLILLPIAYAAAIIPIFQSSLQLWIGFRKQLVRNMRKDSVPFRILRMLYFLLFSHAFEMI